MKRKLLQMVVGTAALFPVILGLLGLVNGAENYLGQEVMNPNLDSNIRFRSAILLTYGLTFFMLLPAIETQTALFRLLLCGLFFGGIARLISIYKFGMPAPILQLILALELSLPIILIPWQGSLAKRTTD